MSEERRQQIRRAVFMAVLDADNCPDFYASPDEPCDGLSGCESCVRLATDAIVCALDKIGALK